MLTNKFCRKCGHDEFIKNGVWPNGSERKKCKRCGSESVTNESRVLVIPDTHFPFEHERALSFCKAIYDRFGCNKVVCTGDILDQHQMSRHTSEADAMGAMKEIELAKKSVKAWSDAFPYMDIVYGNHDKIPERQAKEVGLPSVFIKDLSDVYGMPDGWVFHKKLVWNGVLYKHNIGSGQYAAINGAKQKSMSVVCGHTHKYGGTIYFTNPTQMFFGLNVGCLIDKETYAMRYSDDDICLGCGVVLGGDEAFFVPMKMGENYDKYKGRC